MKTIVIISLMTLFLLNSVFSQNNFRKVLIEGDIEAIKTYLQQEPSLVNKVISSIGETPLMIVCQISPNYSVIQLLIEKGARINVKDYDGMSPLMHVLSFFTIKYQEKKKIFFLLIDKGAYIDVQNSAGFTPLMAAVNIGDIDLVKKLIESNVNLNIHNNNSQTALDIAKEKENKEIIKLLTDNGAKTAK